MHRLSLFCFLSLLFLTVSAGNPYSPLDAILGCGTPKYEVRAVWLTTIGGIDWPHSYAQSPRSIKKQKQELREILNRLQKANINTVLIQTRIRGTMIYPSRYEPWDGCLSGFPGKSPGYDALAFVIEECHKRGMEVQAWVVTLPVGKWNQLGCRNLRRQFPGLIRRIGPEGYMNPEDSRTGDYLAQICKEITHNYDVDGIHLDYIRYPETWKLRVNKSQGRAYITSIVRKIHDAVKTEKPWVKLSCSPIGKFDDLSRYWSHGWNAYDKVCQDAQGWLREGLMDELFPMMYFRDEQFFPFAINWKEEDDGKIIAPGLGIYFLDPKEGQWQIGDVTREMYQLRHYEMGQAFFRSKFLTDNTQGIYTFVSDNFYRYPALIPPMKWATPVPTDTTYNIYVSPHFPVDTADARNLMAIRLSRGDMERSVKLLQGSPFTVTSINRYGKENIFLESGNPQPTLTEDFLQCDGKRLQLPPKSNNLDADAVLIRNLLGQVIASRPYHNPTLSVGDLPEGIYKLYSLNRKGFTHRLGTFLIRRP